MTDQELIEKLRLGFANPIVAADRIEDLLKFSSYWHNRTEALEAKLTKAVEALRETTKMLSQCTFTNGQYFERRKVVDKANATLAELEGETK